MQKEWNGASPQERLALDQVDRRGDCDEDMDVGSISNAGIRPSPAGCDEDLMGSIP